MHDSPNSLAIAHRRYRIFEERTVSVILVCVLVVNRLPEDLGGCTKQRCSKG